MFLYSDNYTLFLYILNKKFLISHNVQWILQDIPIGRNIQNIRMDKHMTQQEVITKMQLMGSIMSRSTLANIETGRRNIKVSDLKALQQIFGVDFSEFFKD